MSTAQLGPDNYSMSYGSLPDLKVSIGDIEELRDSSLSDPVERADFLISMRVVPLWPMCYLLTPGVGGGWRQEPWPETMQRSGQQQLWLCLGLGLAHIVFPAEKDRLLLISSVHLTSIRDVTICL